jgi:phage baseplate assembly protein W
VAVKTLALSGGDLVVGPGGLQMQDGAAKIRQDLALALGEDYGADPYHSGWGSVLGQYLGEPMDADIPMLVQAEVNRILQQYMTNQQQQLATAAANQQQHTISTSEIIQTVNSVDVSVLYDSVRVVVSLTTMAGQSLQISRTVS